MMTTYAYLLIFIHLSLSTYLPVTDHTRQSDQLVWTHLDVEL